MGNPVLQLFVLFVLKHPLAARLVTPPPPLGLQTRVQLYLTLHMVLVTQTHILKFAQLPASWSFFNNNNKKPYICPNNKHRGKKDREQHFQSMKCSIIAIKENIWYRLNFGNINVIYSFLKCIHKLDMAAHACISRFWKLGEGCYSLKPA